MKKITFNVHKEVFNDCYLPYLYDKSKFLVFYGGAGSGKSFFIVQRYILKLLMEPRCNILVVRQVGDTNRYSTFALFKQVISLWGLNKYFKINDLYITCKLNKNAVVFKGLDNIEKLKSITFPSGELTDVWIEEASETTEEALNQLITRLRGGKTRKQIVISFNPISVNHWLKVRFFDHQVKGCKILHTTYKDNKFIDDDYKESLEAFKETDPYYYAVYCLGQWGVYGKTVFDSEKVQARLSDNVKPVKCGYFEFDYDGLKITNIRFVKDKDGYILIYKEPNSKRPYVLGGDTAGEGSDYFTAQVIDNVSKEQVATFRNMFDEDIYTRQIYCLGKYYNDALVGIETNYSTYPQKELERLGYSNFFVRMREDTYTHKHIKSFGFQTNQKTRPIIIAELVKIVRENTRLISDKDTLLEMLTFVRNEKGRPEAQEGAHDDLIMGLAIAYYITAQAKDTEDVVQESKKIKWTEDMYEDYLNADAEGRKYLTEKWGEPG